jgi:hypothetical protein
MRVCGLRLPEAASTAYARANFPNVASSKLAYPLEDAPPESCNPVDLSVLQLEVSFERAQAACFH